MVLSYHGIVGHKAKATLPCVEAALGSMVIPRDPPKSIMTRQKTRVGANNDLIDEVDASGDRIEEAILVYPRGVNPMVSVSYSNYGNNGGQRAGGIKGNSNISTSNPRMPYALGAGGFNFRPPIIKPQDLLPLSRKPRAIVCASAQKSAVNYTQMPMCSKSAEFTPGVNAKSLNVSVQPTCTYRLEKPIEEPFEIKYVIKNPQHISATSGFKESQLVQHDVVKPYANISDSSLHAYADTQRTSSLSQNSSHTNKDTSTYTHASIPTTNVTTNMSERRDVTPIDSLIDVDKHIQDSINVTYDGSRVGPALQKYIHDDVTLVKNLPSHSADTNRAENIHKTVVLNPYQKQYERKTPATEAYSSIGSSFTAEKMFDQSRDIKLRPKIQPGGFDGAGTIPMTDRPEMNKTLNNTKHALRKEAFQNYQNRFDSGLVHAPKVR